MPLGHMRCGCVLKRERPERLSLFALEQIQLPGERKSGQQSHLRPPPECAQARDVHEHCVQRRDVQQFHHLRTIAICAAVFRMSEESVCCFSRGSGKRSRHCGRPISGRYVAFRYPVQVYSGTMASQHTHIITSP